MAVSTRSSVDVLMIQFFHTAVQLFPERAAVNLSRSSKIAPLKMAARNVGVQQHCRVAANVPSRRI